MATRALATVAVTGRRAAGQTGLAVLSSSHSCYRRGGGTHTFSHSTAERELDGHADADATAEQVEASLNRKNVDVVEGDHSATLLATDVAEALRGVGDADAAAGAGAEDAWVPNQETGVFVPADEASGDGNGADDGGARRPSVLDQTVFVREDMEDVERPSVGGTVDVADAGAK